MSPGATGSTGSAGGMSTASITWMTPLLASTSAVVTFAPSIMTPASETVKDASSPFNIVTVIPSVTLVEATAPT